nr:reverse transcriptase domain-containing protein [Tanacetum cinerariifolium]
MVSTVEVVLTNGALLLAETALEAETAPMASKNRMVIPTPLSEQGTNIESGTSEGGHWKLKSKRRKPTYEDLAAPGHVKRNQPRDGRGFNKFTPLTRTPKDIFAVELGKFKPPPLMLRKQIEELEYHDRLPSTDSISEKDTPMSDRKTKACLGTRQGNPSRDTKTDRGGNFVRRILPRLVIQPSHGEEARRAAEGMFLGYMINPEGIKPCPDKTKAVLQLPSPRTIKEVQSLNEKLASLNRFIFKSAKKSLPLFKTLKKCIKKSDFHWTLDAEQAFKQLKQNLARLPMLVAPRPKEEPIMYLSASYGAISAVLMTERDTVQTPVYFVSRALQAPELNYTPMEKLVPTLVMLRLEMARRLQKCSVMLREHNITYRPRTSVKRQILADFLVEKPDDAPPEASVTKLYRSRGYCSRTDHHVLIDQEENMVNYLKKAKSLISGFANFFISQVPRSKNKKADALSKIVSTNFAHLSKHVLVEVLKHKSIQEKEVETVVDEEGPTWMTPIMEYLKDGTIPGDRKEASKLRIKARQYELLEGVLYKRSFLKPWLRKCQVFDNRYGLFHKVDRVESCGNNHWHSGEEVHVGQHSMPLRSPKGNSLEQRMPTYRITVVDAVHNNEELRLKLDLLEERRECAAIREAKAKLRMTSYYNTRVCGITFRLGDFVYHSNEASHVMDGGKLDPKWEGPYEVTEALEEGVYMLRSTNGTVLPQT